MAITVEFYKNVSEERRLEKSLTLVKGGVNCDIFNPTDRLNPVLIIKNEGTTTDTFFNIKECNYMYIEAFGRWYYITNIEGDAARRLYIYAHVDVLQTYKNQIKNCNCTAARSSSDYNFYLQDNARLFNAYTWNQYLDIGEVGEPSLLTIITA